MDSAISESLTVARFLSLLKTYSEINPTIFLIPTLQNVTTTSGYLSTIIVEEQKCLEDRLRNNVVTLPIYEKVATITFTHRSIKIHSLNQAISANTNNDSFFAVDLAALQKVATIRREIR